ncbi:MAG TPA: tripartite tricarboxylate transporter substrate binding protein [Xanthobacteraceae bacterium]|nr:tripartite tricarboxylate transporter substrate binding protein [Xanthobacteraceae bacterium]
MLKSRFGIGAILAVGLALLTAAPGRAEDHYPSRLVKIVVPAAAGSTTDTLARLLADQLGRKWGQSVIVENISGAAMNLGSERVARSDPDGYTLLVAPPSPLSLNQMLFKDLAYDPTQFTPITLVAKIANVLSVRNDFPAKSIKELVAYAKANPGKLTFASQGVGSTAHLSASQLELLAGIKMVHVPYRGAMPALNDVMAGHVDMFFDTLATSVPLFRAGKIKILAVAGPERASAIPDVPTIAESGLPGFRSITWFGLVAPPKTPADLVAHINRDAVEVLKSKEVTATLAKLSLEPGATSPAETAKFFAAETQLWSKVIKETGLKPQ